MFIVIRLVMSIKLIAAIVRQCVGKAEEEAAAAAAVGVEEDAPAEEVPTIGSVIANTLVGLGFEPTAAALDAETTMQNNPESMEYGERM